MSNRKNTAIVWFRNDLRLKDNPAFIAACNNHEYIIPLYILDSQASLGSAQYWWLHHSLKSLDKSLIKHDLKLILKRGRSIEIFREIISSTEIQAVYWNNVYEPLAFKEDQNLKELLLARNISVNTSNGSLLNEPWNIKNKQGEYFKVFSFFWKECLRRIQAPLSQSIKHYPKMLSILSDNLEEWKLLPQHPNWASGFEEYWTPGEDAAQAKLKHFIEHSLENYKDDRNLPASGASSKLSPHLHFGEISVWDIWKALDYLSHTSNHLASIECFLSELGWREFAYYLLYHNPSLPHQNCRKEFDNFSWDNNTELLKLWQQGKTGYPIIDAGMRELWHTGYMHNRVRMIVASFLTKNLLIDWRLGAEWFFYTLLDADLANNSMNWQWVAGSGIDPAPYFRIFNPSLQSQKFDHSGGYIKKWVPELSNVKAKYLHEPWSIDGGVIGLRVGKDYPAPIINYAGSREKALKIYKSLKQS